MKKIFTLIAMAMSAMSMSAQGEWSVPAEWSGTKKVAGTTVTDVTNITLKFGGDDADFSFGTDNDRPELGVYCTGNGVNPVDENDKKIGNSAYNVPTKGTFYKFTPTINGILTVVTVPASSGKVVYAITPQTSGNVATTVKSVTAEDKKLTEIQFNVEADKDYYIATPSSKTGLKSFTLSTGSIETPPAADGTHIISFNGMGSANKVVYDDDLKGFILQITGNEEKTLGGGNDFTIGGKTYKSIKNSNGAETTLTLPEGKVASGITLYSYVNKAKEDGVSYFWKKIAGVDFADAAAAGGEFESFQDAANPDKIEYQFNGKTNSITFNNTGAQMCFVIEVTIETAEATAVTEVTVKSTSITTGITEVKTVAAEENAPAYNLAGQKVSDSYKGVVIKGGKKVVVK